MDEDGKPLSTCIFKTYQNTRRVFRELADINMQLTSKFDLKDWRPQDSFIKSFLYEGEVFFSGGNELEFIGLEAQMRLERVHEKTIVAHRVHSQD